MSRREGLCGLVECSGLSCSGVVAVHVGRKPPLGGEDVGRGPVLGVVMHTGVIDYDATGRGKCVRRRGLHGSGATDGGGRGGAVGDCDALGGRCYAADGEDDWVNAKGFVLQNV